MREHKYRAWDKKNKILFKNIRGMSFDKEGKIICLMANHDGKTYDYINKTVLRDCSFNPKVVRGKIEDIELIQFIGRKDKNGKDIYEGYIVIHKAVNAYGSVYDTKLIIGSDDCPFTDCGWLFRDNDSYYKNDNEVIGNIYENAELIK